MMRLVIVLIMSLAVLVLGLSRGHDASAGPPPDCIDPSPDGGGEPEFNGIGTPNHWISVDGDLCPGETDVWTFSSSPAPVSQYLGVRVLRLSGGDVSAVLKGPLEGPVELEVGQGYFFAPSEGVVSFNVRVTGEGPGLASYRFQACRAVFSPCPFGSHSGTSPGDANCDGVIDARDATMILQFAAGLFFAPGCKEAAELDGSAGITPRDALLVLQFVAGLIHDLPAR